jgi:hypothetical protein
LQLHELEQELGPDEQVQHELAESELALGASPAAVYRRILGHR